MSTMQPTEERTAPSVRERRHALAERFSTVRATTERLAAPLSAEDAVVQSMPDASPTKWHLGHTTWFFETFVLRPAGAVDAPFDRAFEVLFNSYYNAIGEQHPRPERGMLTRPSLDRVREYRRAVDAALLGWLESERSEDTARLDVVEVGLHHEQQHQELLLMDAKHLLSRNPTEPAYRDDVASYAPAHDLESAHEWVRFEGGDVRIGDDGAAFAYDNEGPRHLARVPSFELASRPVTHRDYLEFIEDGGYRRPELWLADGWTTVRERGWEAPLYWTFRDGHRGVFTLGGHRDLGPDEPVAHVSYYEADAFARWSAARLPTEFEWEVAAGGRRVSGNLLGSDRLHPGGPGGAGEDGAIRRLFGDVWEWTSSAYAPYPGYRPPEGAIGEYNGKFMCNQYVLRGGACVTPDEHVRPTYRNFFYPSMRWQFAGIRLARDVA